MNDDFLFRDLVENEERVGCCSQSPNDRVIGSRTDLRVLQKKLNELLDAPLDPLRSLRRGASNVTENRLKVRKGQKCVAELHRPYFAQAARTCSPVANSPRAAASTISSIVPLKRAPICN